MLGCFYLGNAMKNPVYEEILKPVVLPRMYRVRQLFDTTKIEDVAGTVRKEVLAFPEIDKVKGKTVAVGVGSRGIANLPVIVKTLIDCLKEKGANVFIVPSMGSHGVPLRKTRPRCWNIWESRRQPSEHRFAPAWRR